MQKKIGIFLILMALGLLAGCMTVCEKDYRHPGLYGREKESIFPQKGILPDNIIFPYREMILSTGPRIGHSGYAEQIMRIFVTEVEGEKKFVVQIYDPVHGFVNSGLLFYIPYKTGETLLEISWGERTFLRVDGRPALEGPPANPQSIYGTGRGQVILGAWEENYGGLKDFWQGKIVYYENSCTGTVIRGRMEFDGIDDYRIIDETFVDKENQPFYPPGKIKVGILARD